MKYPDTCNTLPVLFTRSKVLLRRKLFASAKSIQANNQLQNCTKRQFWGCLFLKIGSFFKNKLKKKEKDAIHTSQVFLLVCTFQMTNRNPALQIPSNLSHWNEGQFAPLLIELDLQISTKVTLHRQKSINKTKSNKSKSNKTKGTPYTDFVF